MPGPARCRGWQIQGNGPGIGGHLTALGGSTARWLMALTLVIRGLFSHAVAVVSGLIAYLSNRATARASLVHSEPGKIAGQVKEQEDARGLPTDSQAPARLFRVARVSGLPGPSTR